MPRNLIFIAYWRYSSPPFLFHLGSRGDFGLSFYAKVEWSLFSSELVEVCLKCWSLCLRIMSQDTAMLRTRIIVFYAVTWRLLFRYWLLVFSSQNLKEFLQSAEAEVRLLASLYSAVVGLAFLAYNIHYLWFEFTFVSLSSCSDTRQFTIFAPKLQLLGGGSTFFFFFLILKTLALMFFRVRMWTLWFFILERISLDALSNKVLSEN